MNKLIPDSLKMNVLHFVTHFREIVNSKLFKDLMQDILREESNLFYSQFRMNLHERKRLIQRSYISPPRALINRIFEEVLYFFKRH